MQHIVEIFRIKYLTALLEATILLLTKKNVNSVNINFTKKMITVKLIHLLRILKTIYSIVLNMDIMIVRNLHIASNVKAIILKCLGSALLLILQ